MTAPSRKHSARSDTITVVTLGAAVLIGIAYLTSMRLAETFGSSLGIAWTIPIDETPINATVGSGTDSVEVIVREGTVFARAVNAVSVTMLIASIVIATLVALIVLACAITVALSAARGESFTRGTVRAWNAAGFTLIVGGAAMMFCDTLAGNGILAAVGLADADVDATGGWMQYAPLWAAGAACILVAVAFGRGRALQRDVQGLV